MAQPNLSRRKFMATSSTVAASILAIGMNPSYRAVAQDETMEPSETIHSVDQIAPFGIVQNSVHGALRDELTQTTQSATIAEYEALASSSTLVRASHLAPDRYQEINQRILNIRTSMANDSLRYTNYTMESQIEGVWAEQATASVIWTEKIVFNLAGDPDPDAPHISFETKTHLTSLRKDGGIWYVEFDDENFGISPLVSDPYNPPTPIAAAPASTDRQYRVHLPIIQNPSSEQTSDNTFGKFLEEDEVLASSSQGAYSRTDAAAYAQQYGSSGGMDGYHKFINNCTNFISRCLRAGGWTERAGWYKSIQGWWYHGHAPTYSSYTWHNCRYWKDFTQNNGRGDIIHNIWDLWAGDILLYDWGKDGLCDHAAICHYRSKWSGAIYMAQHNSSYAWKSLSEIVAGYENEWGFYPFRMRTNF